MKIGDIVQTLKYGRGIVVDKEMTKKSWNSEEIIHTGRFGVKLDNPEMWPCSHISDNTAYFYPDEIKILDNPTTI